MDNKLFNFIIIFIIFQFSSYIYMINTMNWTKSIIYSNILTTFYIFDIILVILVVKIIRDDEK